MTSGVISLFGSRADLANAGADFDTNRTSVRSAFAHWYQAGLPGLVRLGAGELDHLAPAYAKAPGFCSNVTLCADRVSVGLYPSGIVNVG